MGKINLLDCTLRDGGYVNDWNFGVRTIKDIIDKINKTNVECVEIGFMRGDVYDENKSLFPDINSTKELLKNKNNNCLYFLMYDMSKPVPLDRFEQCDHKSIDGIRIIFKKNKIDEAYEVCKQIKQLGYLISINFVNTDFYDDIEFENAIKKYNDLDPYAIAIVDTFGSMKNKKFLHLVDIANKYLKTNISLCYHSHNNLQQAYLNATSFVEMNLDRDIIIDASVFGMGRGAGNLNIELFAEYMNEYHNKNYHIVPMLEIMDEYLQDIYKTKFWGYSLPLYISASLNTHPNYGIFFAEKGTLTEKSMFEIMKNMTVEEKQIYDKNIAEQKYLDYMSNKIDDSDDLSNLNNIFKNKNILIIAPGKSINDNIEKINNFLMDKNTISISVNFYDDKFKTDFLFSSNMRRYNKLDGLVPCETIITSNMLDAKNKNFVLNYYSLIIEDKDIMDNSGLMAIKMLINLGIKSVYIAGMDGYDDSNPYVYNSIFTHYDFSNVANIRNNKIKMQIDNFKKYINIDFITKSIYE